MSVTYSQTSPYATTNMFGGKFLDVMDKRNITKSPSDTVYVIDRLYEYRPDLLAYDLYGDSTLWWVFAMRNPNSIKDPIFSFYVGNVIYLPNKGTLFADLGL